jgi:hypothetical protein
LTPARIAETVLGLAVVAALAATAFVVRHRRDVDRAPAVTAGADAASSQRPAGEPPGADVPDLTRADATLEVGPLHIRASASPRPPRAFTRMRFRFRVEDRGAGSAGAADGPTVPPAPLAEARLSFTMSMPMGDHHYRLAAAPDGWHEAEVVLPLCASGDRRWFGRLDFTLEGRARSARFTLALDDPTGGAGTSTGR